MSVGCPSPAGSAHTFLPGPYQSAPELDDVTAIGCGAGRQEDTVSPVGRVRCVFLFIILTFILPYELVEN